MASVTVRTGPVSADDKARDVDKERWIELTWARRAFVATNVPYDCRSLLAFVDEAESFRIWEQTGHSGLDDYIRNGLEIDPDLVEWARVGLESLDRSKPQSLDDAVKAGKKTAAQMLEEAPELKPTGRPPKNGKVVEYTTLGREKTGHSTDRLAARIKRDHPEIAAKVQSGEIKSINAAAIEAGIKRQHRSIPIDSPESAIKALTRVFTVDELVRAIGEIADGQAA